MAKRRRKDKMDDAGNLIGFGLLFIMLLSLAYRPIAEVIVGWYFPGASLADTQSLPAWVFGVYNLLQAPMMLLPPYALLWGAGGSRGLRVPLGKPQVPVQVMLPLFFAGMLAVNSVSSLVRTALTAVFQLPPVQPMALPEEGGALVLYLVAASVMPAVFEELVFRGAIQGLLRPFGRRFAIVAATIPFVLLHANVWDIPAVLVLSLLLGYFAEVGGSVWPCILLHLANNLFVLLLALAQQRMEGTAALALAMLVVLAFLSLIVWAVWTIRQQKLGKKLLLPKDSARLKQKRPARIIRLLRAPVFAFGLLAMVAVLVLRLYLA